MGEPNWNQIIARALKREAAPKPQTDGWQKVSVVASVFSTVVLAAMGLMLQRWNANTTAALSQAQLEATRAKNSDDARVQEGQLVSSLLKQLFELNGKHRAAILVVLETHLPKERYIALCGALAKEDSEEPVRLAAIRQLGSTGNLKGSSVLSSIVNDPSRPPNERLLAEKNRTTIENNRRQIFESIKAVKSEGSQIKIGVHLVGDCKEEGTTSRCLEGQGGILEIDNLSSRILFFQVLDLGTSGSISSLLRPDAPVGPGQKIRTRRYVFGGPYGTEILKVFASEDRIDMSIYENAAVSRSGGTEAIVRDALVDHGPFVAALIQDTIPTKSSIGVLASDRWAVVDYSVNVQPK